MSTEQSHFISLHPFYFSPFIEIVCERARTRGRTVLRARVASAACEQGAWTAMPIPPRQIAGSACRASAHASWLLIRLCCVHRNTLSNKALYTSIYTWCACDRCVRHRVSLWGRVRESANERKDCARSTRSVSRVRARNTLSSCALYTSVYTVCACDRCIFYTQYNFKYFYRILRKINFRTDVLQR